ncbi:MAG: aspartyl/asparaginyl beta-hydroxylase domain-containing protein [Pseudomonadota bacterium]
MGWGNGFGLLSNDTSRPIHYRFAKRQRHRINDWIARSSLIPNEPILDASQFFWTQKLSQNWAVIRDEALAIYRNRDAIPPLRDISPDHRRLVQDHSWRSFFLIGYGHHQTENMARAPRTSELVGAIPGLNSAFFSILAPGTVIVPHRGVTKAFYTGHLGLVVPRDTQGLWMRVDKQRIGWREGEWLIFDDTYEHEVRNDTPDPRIVLLVQVERPLKAPGKWLAHGLMAYVKRSHFVRDANANLQDWEKVYAAAERRDD